MARQANIGSACTKGSSTILDKVKAAKLSAIHLTDNSIFTVDYKALQVVNVMKLMISKARLMWNVSYYSVQLPATMLVHHAMYIICALY